MWCMSRPVDPDVIAEVSSRTLIERRSPDLERSTRNEGVRGRREHSARPQLLVLLAVGDPWLRASLGTLLRPNGYATLEAISGEQAVSQSRVHSPDLIVLDVAIAEWGKRALVTSLLACGSAPIIALVAREQEEDRITVLDAGASDCLTRDTSGAVLVARIGAVLGSNELALAEERTFANGWRMNLATRDVFVDNVHVPLPPRQFEIFSILAHNAGTVVPYRTLLVEVWGSALNGDVSALRVHMQQLRDKLEVDPRRPRFLLTAPRVGYCFEPGSPL